MQDSSVDKLNFSVRHCQTDQTSSGACGLASRKDERNRQSFVTSVQSRRNGAPLNELLDQDGIIRLSKQMSQSHFEVISALVCPPISE